MKTISMPICNRPEYLTRVLQSLREAIGHEEWTLIFSAEPGCPKVREIAQAVDFMPFYYHQNTFRMGCDGNTFMAAELAWLAGSEFNIHLEDDIIIGWDTLNMAEWFRRNQPEEMSILAFRRSQEDRSKPNILRHAGEGLLGCGFAWATRHWEHHLRGWWHYWEPEMPAFGWDLQLHYTFNKKGVQQFRPMANRSQHIGYFGGAHTHASTYDPNLGGPRYQGTEKEFQYG